VIQSPIDVIQVEEYMNLIIDKMRAELKINLYAAVLAYDNPKPRHEWLFDWTSQMILVVNQIYWCVPRVVIPHLCIWSTNINPHQLGYAGSFALGMGGFPLFLLVFFLHTPLTVDPVIDMDSVTHSSWSCISQQLDMFPECSLNFLWASWILRQSWYFLSVPLVVWMGAHGLPPQLGT
jgi:hypothetical protein